MSDLESLLRTIRALNADEKQQVFNAIRGDIAIHSLEKAFNARAEIILEAISRASDLTQRGVRGLIAETAFVLDVMPTVPDWSSEPPVGDVSFDACLSRGKRRIRIQVKTQRRVLGAPMKRNGLYVVEVQRTRTGEKNGEKTRPYRFGDFDLLAVCMWASTGSWHSFAYAPASKLLPDSGDASIIKTFQMIPNLENGDDPIWTNDLAAALDRVAST